MGIMDEHQSDVVLPEETTCADCRALMEYVAQLEESLLQTAFEKQQLMDLLQTTVQQMARLREAVDALAAGQTDLVAVLVASEELDVPDLRHQQLD